MFRYELVNSTRKFTIVAEIVSLLKKIYKRDAPFRAVFKVKTLAVLFLAYPREMKHILRNLNLPPFWRCLFLWKWCNPFPRARAWLKHAHSFDRCGVRSNDAQKQLARTSLTALKKTVLWSVFNRASATLLRFKEYCENVLFKVTHLRFIKTRFLGFWWKAVDFKSYLVKRI